MPPEPAEPALARAERESKHRQRAADSTPSVRAHEEVQPSENDLFQPGSPLHAIDLSKIEWRPRKPQASDLPHDYDELKALAEAGDANAALRLFDQIEFCNELNPIGQTDEEFDAMVDREIGRLDTNVFEKVLVERYLRHTVGTCDTYTEDRRAGHEDWLALAAGLGSIDAQSKFASQFNDVSVAIDMWHQGNLDGLWTASVIHKRRYNNGDDPEAGIQSYAHLLAYKMLLDASESAATPGQRPRATTSDDFVATEKLLLTEWQVTEAERLAAELLRNRKNCCISNWYSLPEN